MTRKDITARDVARRWLDGETINSIALSLGVSDDLINRRLRVARKRFPKLSWSERKPRRAKSPTKEFVTMKDGTPGDTDLRCSSIVPSRTTRRIL